MPYFGFVSCDVVGHSAVQDLAIQRRRLAELNGLIREAIQRNGESNTVWASGGDGGHLAFCQQGWQQSAIDYLTQLRRWSEAEEIGLRIIGHYGEVDSLEGADGRVQLVGEGINLAGRLLARAFPQGVLVTDAFKTQLANSENAALRLHDPRVLRLKYFAPQTIHLLSIIGVLRSEWDKPEGGDRDELDRALAEGNAWQAIRLIKRLLQTNSLDEQAEIALNQISPHLLVYRQSQVPVDGRGHDRWVPNPFLGELTPNTRQHVIRSAQLVERARGEALCRVGEEGDTMFIVLEGEVGAFPPDPITGEIDRDPRVVFGQGEIVGELAFTLRRPRTADLLATNDVTLLAVHASELETQARINPGLADSLERFLTGRVLEYICNSADYLIGRDENGPLAGGESKRTWDRLLPHTEKLVCPLSDPRPVSLQGSQFAGDGLYILVSGRLRSVAHADKVICGTDLPLVYIDLSGWVVTPDHPYRPEGSDAVILRIGKDALLGRRPVIDTVAARVKKELPRTFHYDVFLSYTFDDQSCAERWRSELEAAGLRVYMEVARSGHYFRDRIEAGILDSLTLLALVSANTMSRPLDQNWVRQEIAFRQAAFESRTAQIYPVRLRGGKPELLADGYTVIDSVGREEFAIAEIIQAVLKVRNGEVSAPYSLSRKAGLRLGQTSVC
jgi:CRP-like cAMP-binding protein